MSFTIVVYDVNIYIYICVYIYIYIYIYLKSYVDNMYNAWNALDVRSRSSPKSFVFVYSGVRYISFDTVLDCSGSRGPPLGIYFLIMRHC